LGLRVYATGVLLVRGYNIGANICRERERQERKRTKHTLSIRCIMEYRHYLSRHYHAAFVCDLAVLTSSGHGGGGMGTDCECASMPAMGKLKRVKGIE